MNRAGSSTSSVRSPPPLHSPAPGSSFNKKPPPPPGAAAAAPPPYTPPSSDAVAPITRKAPPPPPPIKPKPKQATSIVVALYDFAAQAEGDLSFRAGDQIEVVEKTDSSEDWWTGRIGDLEGVFPGASRSFFRGCVVGADDCFWQATMCRRPDGFMVLNFVIAKTGAICPMKSSRLRSSSIISCLVWIYARC